MLLLGQSPVGKLKPKRYGAQALAVSLGVHGELLPAGKLRFGRVSPHSNEVLGLSVHDRIGDGVHCPSTRRIHLEGDVNCLIQGIVDNQWNAKTSADFASVPAQLKLAKMPRQISTEEITVPALLRNGFIKLLHERERELYVNVSTQFGAVVSLWGVLCF
jgi:hypothetical protein